MAPCEYVDVPIGFKFRPSDDELLRYYLLNKVSGTPFKYSNVVPEFNLYGKKEPWDIWNDFGGQNLEKGEDLYFFTKLKLVTGKGSRVARTIGNGTWKGEDKGTTVRDPAKKNTPLGLCKRFRYENEKSDQHGCWIMHEYSLHPSLVKPQSNSNTCGCDGKYVLCRIRKNDRKRKLSENDGVGGHALILQSPTKIPRQLESSDEVVLGANSTPISEASEVTNHYNQQPEQTTTANAYLPTDQPHYFLTDYPTTMASASTSPPPSLPQPDYGFELISDTDHQPAQGAGFNYDLSQFLDSDDVDALLKDLSNLDNIQPLTAQPLGGGSHPYPCIIEESAVDEDSGNINTGLGISSEDQTGGELGTENVSLNVSGFPVHDDEMLDFLNRASFDDLVDMIQFEDNDDELQAFATSQSVMGMESTTTATTY
ncbi:unnamed protein product [Prunus armeniaca]|uniref:NAC domain-containing protein n=1 Tax=Prunus armeniaca TaxID=36596 RepID=A0A6J5TXJ7_PRUAR|nr:unnamed protein product [Prunus armeniaca]